MKKEQTNHEFSWRELPYEKFLHKGPQSLTDMELLAIIIRSGTKQQSATNIAETILDKLCKQRGLLELQHLSVEELMAIDGIGKVKATKMKCIVELSNRIATYKASYHLRWDCPETIAEFYMEQMRHLEQEHVKLILLDGKNQLIEDRTLSKGSVNASIVNLRDLFINALQGKAVYIILLHNHPSGDPSPSKQDILITKRIQEASTLMDIPLLDHIIIGDQRYFSMKEQKLL